MSAPKFNPEETKSRGIYKTYGSAFGYPPALVEMYNWPITPRENLERYLYGTGEYYWIPNLYTDCNQLFTDTTPDCIAQEFAGGIDGFGCVWVPVEGGMLPSFVRPGNPIMKDIEDWESFPWPDPDTWDWKKMRETYEPYMYPDRYNMGYVCGVFFERLIHLLDSENAMCAVLEDEEAVDGIFTKLEEYHIKTLEHMKKDLDIDIVWIGDDWGTQRAPFISRTVLQELIAPHYKKLLDKCEELHIYPVTHSCGRTACYMDLYVDMGIKMWEPQTDCNPDIYDIQKNFKDQMKIATYLDFGDFTGTMSAEEFRKDTEDKARRLLMDKNVIMESAAWDDLWAEKNRIMYEVLRKVASDEL